MPIDFDEAPGDGNFAEQLCFVTSRCRIEPCDAATAAAVHLIATDPAVAEGFFAPGSRSITADDHSQWVQRHDDWTLRRLVNFVVRDHDGGMPIGQLGIAGGEISFCIKRDRWGCGLATELVGGFCVNAGTMLGLSHLVARVSRGNIGSRVVLERCGFRFAGLVSGPAFAERRPDLFLRYVAAI